jgi:hypothetical protein
LSRAEPDLDCLPLQYAIRTQSHLHPPFERAESLPAWDVDDYWS